MQSKQQISSEAMRMSSSGSLIAPLTIDEKRQIVYSSLLKFASETTSLRERALDRVVLGALIDSSEEAPFRIGRIQDNLKFAPNAPSIRDEVIQESLNRLIEHKVVKHKELLRRHAYYLTQDGIAKLGEFIESSEQLLNVVARRLLKDTTHLVSFEIGATVFRQFIFNCFARYGQIIAKNVTGQISQDNLARAVDIASVFNAASHGKDLSDEASDSLKARCMTFLKSTDQDDERLKFNLTQGYYFTQLLGFEGDQFNPLSEHAFTNSAFYLDTNVLLSGILSGDENATLFQEMLGVTQRLGIELKVTRATINEARRVAADRLPQINQVISIIPEGLIQLTDDQFLQAFLQAREVNASLTPETFLEPFDRLPIILEQKWNITLYDSTEDEIICGRDFTKASTVINEVAVSIRGWGKSEIVLKHDICHYALVLDERDKNPKTWFLTRDRTLAQAALKLAGADPSFSFSLIGFLHSISPFLTTATEENSFVDIFSSFFIEQTLSTGPLFEARELALMAEFHEDVMATPIDQLIMAFDYVKSKTLQGQPYNRSDIPLVSLELKKFLASSKEEQVLALQDERERLASLSQSERKMRREAEEETIQQQVENKALRQEINLLRLSETSAKNEVDIIKERLEEQENRLARNQQTQRMAAMVLGFACGVLLWLVSDSLLFKLNDKFPLLQNWLAYEKTVMKLIVALLFALPAFFFIRRTHWRHELQLCCYIILTIVALFLSQLLDKEAISTWSSYVDIATLIASLFFALLVIDRNK